MNNPDPALFPMHQEALTRARSLHAAVITGHVVSGEQGHVIRFCGKLMDSQRSPYLGLEESRSPWSRRSIFSLQRFMESSGIGRRYVESDEGT